MKSPGVERPTDTEGEMEIIHSVVPPPAANGDNLVAGRNADPVYEKDTAAVVDGVRLDEVVEPIPPEAEGAHRSDKAVHGVSHLRLGPACTYYRSSGRHRLPYFLFPFLTLALMSAGWLVGGRLWSEPESETIFSSDRSAAVITEHSFRTDADRPVSDSSTDIPETASPIVEESELTMERAQDVGSSAGQTLPSRGTVESPPPVSMRDEGAVEDAADGSAVVNDPIEASRLFTTSIRHFNNGDYEASIRSGHEAWEVDSKNPQIVNHVAAVYLQTGEWALAESWSWRALEIDPGLDKAWTNLGAALLKQGRVEKAEEIYHRMVREDSQNWKALAALAAVWTEMGSFDKSIDAHFQAVRIAPDRPELRYNLGVALAGDGRIPDAREAFLAYLNISAGNDPAREAKIRSWLTRHP